MHGKKISLSKLLFTRHILPRSHLQLGKVPQGFPRETFGNSNSYFFYRPDAVIGAQPMVSMHTNDTMKKAGKEKNYAMR